MADPKVRKGVLRNRIVGVGVELEGGWHKNPLWKGRPIGIDRDGSVKFDDKILRAKVNDVAGKIRAAATISKRTELEAVYAKLLKQLEDYIPPYIGEIPSPVLVGDEVDRFIVDCYPSRVNETCGLHVHMSFKDTLNYQRLMTPDYTTFMVKALQEWGEEEKLSKDHPLWNRVNNPRHDHCAHIYLGDAQARQARKDYNSRGTKWSRYTAINYCFKQHKTVECRLLPMMETADQATRAVKAVLKTTNRFLSKIRERERAHKVAVPKAGDFMERIEVQV